MATRVPTATRNAAITGMLVTTTTWKWGLCTTTPGTTGLHELTGTASHPRKPSHTTAAATGKTHNTSALTWTGTGAWTIKNWLINTAATGTGTYKLGGALSGTLTVPSSSTVTAAIGALTIAITG